MNRCFVMPIKDKNSLTTDIRAKSALVYLK